MKNKNLKWDAAKRTMALIHKAKENQPLNDAFEKYMDIIYGVCKDVEVVTETYMRLTNEYDEDIDFMQQWMRMYKKLKLIKLIDNQRAAATWVPLVEAQIKEEKDSLENGMDSKGKKE
jgi:hypothetical protein